MTRNKSNLLLIYNKGELANRVITGLSQHFVVKPFSVVKDMALEKMYDYISGIFESQELSLIVYISGETRNQSNMMKLNFDFPAFISVLCASILITFWVGSKIL